MSAYNVPVCKIHVINVLQYGCYHLCNSFIQLKNYWNLYHLAIISFTQKIKCKDIKTNKYSLYEGIFILVLIFLLFTVNKPILYLY